MKIKTNNQYRYVDYFCELSESVQKEFEYLDVNNEEHASLPFVEYKGQYYDLGEFLLADNGHFKAWDGVASDSYFSGVLCKFDEYDNERVLMASYYC